MTDEYRDAATDDAGTGSDEAKPFATDNGGNRSEETVDAGGPAREHFDATVRPINLSLGERLTTAVAGVGFVALGLTRRHAIPGAALAMIGAGLLWRGLSGHSKLYGVLGVDHSTTEAKRPAREPFDPA